MTPKKKGTEPGKLSDSVEYDESVELGEVSDAEMAEIEKLTKLDDAYGNEEFPRATKKEKKTRKVQNRTAAAYARQKTELEPGPKTAKYNKKSYRS